MKSMFILLGTLLLTACAEPSRNLYEGIKANNDAKRSPGEHAISPAPGYDWYNKEREGKAQE